MQKKVSETKQHIQKADILLILFCLLAALFSGVWLMLKAQSGTFVRIFYDGAELYTIDLEHMQDTDSPALAESEEQYYLITYSAPNEMPEISRSASRPDCSGNSSYNLLCIAGGKVWMEEADCRDQICVHHKPVSGSRESIICLPHKLVIEMTGASPDDTQEDAVLDGMVK